MAMSEGASPGRIRPGDLRCSSPKFGEKKRSRMSESNKGGVFAKAVVGGEMMKISREDVELAFKFLDDEGKGVLKQKDLKAKLEIFFPNFTTKEYKMLIQENNFTIDTLWGLIQDNISYLKDTDPAADAFRVYDPEDTGFLDPMVLRNIMTQIGYKDMTDEDLDVLIQTSDSDKDGKINISDFRKMLGMYPGYEDSNMPSRDREPLFGSHLDDDDIDSLE